MATSLVVNGVSYLYPDTGDQSWGAVASAWASAVTSGTLQKAGGAFTLTADANFGATFGLISPYFTSITANPASAGQVRLADADVIKWRNHANGADIALGKNTSDQLTWAGNAFLSSAGVTLIAGGGTGQTTKTAAFDALSPTTTKGDLIVNNGTNNVNFGVGGDGTVLSSASGQSNGLQWISVLSNPMTTLGDIIYENASPAATRLAGNTTSTKKFLTQTGTGIISAVPGWNTIAAGDLPTIALTGDVTGSGSGGSIATTYATTVSLNKGGTGQTTKAAAFDALQPMTTGGDLIYGGASGTGTRLANGSAGQVLTSAGTTAAPAWTAPNTQTYFLGTQVGVGGGWATTSASFANPSVATTSNTLTTVQSAGFSSIIAESTKLPAITVTFPGAGAYLVSATLSLDGALSGQGIGARLFDSTNSQIINGGVSINNAGTNFGTAVTLTGIEKVAAAGAVTLIVQISADGSHNASINQAATSPITWTIIGL